MPPVASGDFMAGDGEIKRQRQPQASRGANENGHPANRMPVVVVWAGEEAQGLVQASAGFEEMERSMRRQRRTE